MGGIGAFWRRRDRRGLREEAENRSPATILWRVSYEWGSAAAIDFTSDDAIVISDPPTDGKVVIIMLLGSQDDVTFGTYSHAIRTEFSNGLVTDQVKADLTIARSLYD